MDEQLAYDGCEDELSSVVNEKFLIGSLLADDDSYSPTKGNQTPHSQIFCKIMWF